MNQKINGTEEERDAAIERVRKARVGVANALGLFRSPGEQREKTAEDDAKVEAAKKELEAATAELVRIQGNAEVDPLREPAKPLFGKN